MGVRQAARTLRPGYHVELGVTQLEEVQIVDAGDVTVTPYDISRHALRSRIVCVRSSETDRAKLCRSAAITPLHCRVFVRCTQSKGDLTGSFRRPSRHLGHVLQRASDAWHDIPQGV
jgi:hypothetical protein